jgi:hypothetical protein
MFSVIVSSFQLIVQFLPYTRKLGIVMGYMVGQVRVDLVNFMAHVRNVTVKIGYGLVDASNPSPGKIDRGQGSCNQWHDNLNNGDHVHANNPLLTDLGQRHRRVLHLYVMYCGVLKDTKAHNVIGGKRHNARTGNAVRPAGTSTCDLAMAGRVWLVNVVFKHGTLYLLGSSGTGNGH